MPSPNKKEIIVSLQKAFGKHPFFRLMELKVHLLKKDRAVLTVGCNKSTLNMQGSLFGGVISFAADIAMWVALASRDPKIRVATTDMSIHFLDRFEKGHAVFDASVLKYGRRMIMTEVNIYNNEKVLAAHVTGSFLRL